ncbi:MAG: dihydrofolate reductase family protein [Spirochaetia bacterium]|nr:dihydrofolate reductase family protein [Spirochaetia bacterium]
MQPGNRKVILYIAMSLDGYIARPDGDISWLSVVEQEGEDYGYKSFTETVDTVIMGRKTYEKILSFGIEFPHKDKKVYVISRSRKGSDGNVEFSDNVDALLSNLKNTQGKNIYLDGGAELVNDMMQRDLLDEMIISVIPFMPGNGIRLFQEINKEHKLRLMDSQLFSSGLVQLHYLLESHA